MVEFLDIDLIKAPWPADAALRRSGAWVAARAPDPLGELRRWPPLRWQCVVPRGSTLRWHVRWRGSLPRPCATATTLVRVRVPLADICPLRRGPRADFVIFAPALSAGLPAPGADGWPRTSSIGSPSRGFAVAQAVFPFYPNLVAYVASNSLPHLVNVCTTPSVPSVSHTVCVDSRLQSHPTRSSVCLG